MPLARHVPHGTRRAALVGRPGEFHPQPPIEPYVKLSLHTAPRSPHVLLRSPVIWLMSKSWCRFHDLNFRPFAPLAFTSFSATTASSAPGLRHLYCQPRFDFPPACAFRLTCAGRFPSFAVKARIRFLPPIHRSLSLPVSRHPQRLSAPMRERCLLATYSLTMLNKGGSFVQLPDTHLAVFVTTSPGCSGPILLRKAPPGRFGTRSCKPIPMGHSPSSLTQLVWAHPAPGSLQSELCTICLRKY